MKRLLFSLAAAVLLAARAHAVDVEVVSHDPQRPVVTGSVVAFPVSGGDAVEAPLEERRAALPLRLGTWMLTLRAGGFYGIPRAVTLTEKEAGAPVVIDAWASAAIRARVKADDAKVRQLTVRVTDAATPPRFAAHDVLCPVTDTVLSCVLPSGTLDLRLRVTGHVSHYLFSQALAIGKTFDAGELRFIRGASLVGSVTTERGERLRVQEVAVKLAPVRTDDRRDSAAPLQQLTVKPDRRGFFHFDGIPPGEFKVSASTRTLISAEIPVVIYEMREAALRDSLVLAPPRALAVSVTPANAPDGQPWRVSLWRFDGESHLNGVANRQLNADGSATFTRIVPGRYKVEVGIREDAWDDREVTIDDRDERVLIDIASSYVSGTVKLGDRPIAAQLTFGGETGIRQIRMSANEEGRFQGHLPATDTAWDVFVECQFPRVKRTIRQQKAQRDMEIVLPATTLTGKTVDENGQPLKAILTLRRAGDDLQTFSDVNGDFEINGLAAGEYSIGAQAARRGPNGDESLESEVLQVQPKENDVTSVRLVLSPGQYFSGRVLSPAGPVPGATIIAWPADVRAAVNPIVETDSQGRFTRVMPKTCKYVNAIIHAPGFATRMIHGEMPKTAAKIEVSQNGGALDLESDEFGSQKRALIIRHGAVTTLATSLDTRRTTWTKLDNGSWRMHIDLIERGEYFFCAVEPSQAAAVTRGLVQPQDCVSGTVAPFSSLTLRLTSGKS